MSVEDLNRALLEKKASNGMTPTNEDATNKGTNTVYENPPGRSPGTLDAKWGDEPPQGANGNPAVYGTAVLHAAKDTREDMLERLFDSPATSAPAEQKLMGSLLENARDGNPHSPLLRRGRQEKNAEATVPTLSDEVARVLRRT